MTCLRTHCRGTVFPLPDEPGFLRCTQCARTFAVAFGTIIEVVPGTVEKSESKPRSWHVKKWRNIYK